MLTSTQKLADCAADVLGGSDENPALIAPMLKTAEALEPLTDDELKSVAGGPTIQHDGYYRPDPFIGHE